MAKHVSLGTEPIPAGGTEGQVLTKASGGDFDVEWGDSGGTGSPGATGPTGPTGPAGALGADGQDAVGFWWYLNSDDADEPSDSHWNLDDFADPTSATLLYVAANSTALEQGVAGDNIDATAWLALLTDGLLKITPLGAPTPSYLMYQVSGAAEESAVFTLTIAYVGGTYLPDGSYYDFFSFQPSGAQTVRTVGPFTVNYSDVPNDGDTLDLITPEPGEALLGWFSDPYTIADWVGATTPTAYLYQSSGSETTDNLINNAGLEGIAQDNDGWNSVYAAAIGFTLVASNACYSSFRILDGSPIRFKYHQAGGTSSAGRIDFYFQLGRLSAP